MFFRTKEELILFPDSECRISADKLQKGSCHPQRDRSTETLFMRENSSEETPAHHTDQWTHSGVLGLMDSPSSSLPPPKTYKNTGGRRLHKQQDTVPVLTPEVIPAHHQTSGPTLMCWCSWMAHPPLRPMPPPKTNKSTGGSAAASPEGHSPSPSPDPRGDPST